MIVSFGEALLDLFAHPRGASVDDAEHFVPHTGGALANVAIVCARLGAPTRFVGAVGTDGHGRRVVRVLDEAGVDTRFMPRVANRTAVTFVRVGTDGSRSFLFYRTHTADHALTPAHLDAMSPHPLDGATWMLTGTSALVAEPIATAFRHIVREADARAVPRAVDLNVRPHLWSDRDAMVAAVRATLDGAALVKASEEDLAALGCAPTLDALDALAPGALCVLTLAERGAVARVQGGDLACPAEALSEAQVVDATGAGDAFIAGVLARLERDGRPWTQQREDRDLWRDALAVGCALGARAVQAMGATTAVCAPWPDVVQRAFARPGG